MSDEQLDVVEEVLLRSDVGVAMTNTVLDDLRENGAPEGVAAALRAILLSALSGDRSTTATAECRSRAGVAVRRGERRGQDHDDWQARQAEPRRGPKVLLAAGDTFRAAAADQLEQWATRTDSDIVRADRGGRSRFGGARRDRSSARSRLSTWCSPTPPGRRANSTNLLDELAKVRRVADREPGQVVETLLVLDATTGQNALAQAREFLSAASVTGIVLTKLDGTARGGIVIAIERDLGIPGQVRRRGRGR